jgi:hypothetical protein
MPTYADRAILILLYCLPAASTPDILAARPQRRSPPAPAAEKGQSPPTPAAEKRESGPRIGKFEILATHVYVKNLRAGRSEAQAKERGITAAVMGAHARGVRRGGTKTKSGSATPGSETASRKKSLTAETFDEQVAAKMGPFFGSDFLPLMKQMEAAGLSYEEIKKAVGLSPEVGAKITGAEFERRATAYLEKAIPASKDRP